MPIARSHRLRTGRTTEPGRIYLLTFTTRGRVRHFADWTVASTAARALAAPANWSDSRLLCWVLMPDHWHGLVRLGVRDTLSRNVGRAKAGATRALHQEPGGPDLPWMQGFHDRALREEDDILDAARYIVANPLRAGLARRLGDYPFWDAVWL